MACRAYLNEEERPEAETAYCLCEVTQYLHPGCPNEGPCPRKVAQQDEMARKERYAAEFDELLAEADKKRAINPKDLVAADEKRLQLGLIPPVAKEAVARVHMLGAKKYGAFNWRDYPILLSGYLDAMERHIERIRRGEWIDPESGQPHAAHVACGANIIMDADYCGTLTDDLKGTDKGHPNG